ncbi:hypothetical protein WA026_020154 [Henosepilachna vigintioctopunctata]|uniref:Uncharacterized protein n=1 Tax=Henosepilachna vigintioctopunctata TaxID=420089 RepID=A0AAW1U290_9CUCU
MDICGATFVILLFNFDRMVSSTTENTMATSSKFEGYPDKLKMTGKQLQEIPEGHISVRILDLAYNHLSYLPMNGFKNKSFKNITSLDLHQNRINNVSSSAFFGLKILTEVDISSNQITALDSYTFEYNRKLKKLDLSNNRIQFTKSEVFLVSTSINTLILSNNNIDQLYELTFVGLKYLTNLVLDDNCLNTIHSNSLKPLIGIEFLSLAQTNVVSLKTTMFTRIPRILNIESTPLAKKFDPPLTRIKKSQVATLLEAESN